jgi:hypothetical protein
LDDDDLATGLLLEGLVAPVTEVVVVVLLDEEETTGTGETGVVGFGYVGVVVDVEGTGAGEEGEFGAGAGEDGGDTGGGDDEVVGVGAEVGLGVAVVPDPPVIVNCGLALPESPNTSGEEARTPRGSCINMTSGHSAEKGTTYGRRYSWTHSERWGP